MYNVLQQPNDQDTDLQRLQLQMQHLLLQARQNEGTLQKFREIELSVMCAQHLEELISVLIEKVSLLFDLDEVCMVLVDEAGEVRQLLSACTLDVIQSSVIFWDEKIPSATNCVGNQLWVGRFNLSKHKFFLCQHSVNYQSIAILPLLRHQQVKGYLTLASRETERFSRSLATDFLKQLATTVSVCIENTLARHRLDAPDSVTPLAVLYDQPQFYRRLNEEVNRAQRANESLSCFYLEVDHYQLLSEQNGNRGIARMLAGVASLLIEHMRCSDIVARFAAQQFVVLLPGVELVAAEQIAERIRAHVAEHSFGLEQIELPGVTVSVGVSALLADRNRAHVKERGQRLLTTADEAMVRAKHQGCNRVCCFGFC